MPEGNQVRAIPSIFWQFFGKSTGQMLGMERRLFLFTSIPLRPIPSLNFSTHLRIGKLLMRRPEVDALQQHAQLLRVDLEVGLLGGARPREVMLL